MRPAVLACALACASLLACSKTKVDVMRDQLAAGEVEAAKAGPEGAPVCKEPFDVSPEKGCLDAIAKAYGAKAAFDSRDPDQAAAAASALVILREGRADWLPSPDVWLVAMRGASGAGADALRLAVATKMAELAPRFGKKLADEKEAVEMVRAVAAVLPGACADYMKLQPGVAVDTLPPQSQPDHSPCIQKDLARKEGPGATYGSGVWRAHGGVTAHWKDTVRALKGGLEKSSGKPKEQLAAKLAIIEPATQKIVLDAPAPAGNAWAREHMTEHKAEIKAPIAATDAGIFPVDAGGKR